MQKNRMFIWVLPRRRLAGIALLLVLLWAAALLWQIDKGGSSATSSPARKAPLEGLLIAVDAGHGGSDRGVCHFPDDLIEKEINLDMARRLEAHLQTAGARVLLTRVDDVALPLDERADIANRAGADIFLSLHVNRIPGHPECFGAQTFFFPGSEEGERLAKALQDALLAIDPDNYRAPLSGEYRVLRQSSMPGALVEIGFMTNERDRQLIAADDYREQVSQAIVAGLIQYAADST